MKQVDHHSNHVFLKLCQFFALEKWHYSARPSNYAQNSKDECMYFFIE